MDPVLKAYLHTWYENSVRAQQLANVDVNITFDEFLSLWHHQQLKSFTKSFDKGTHVYRQRPDNAGAYVFTWRSYEARSSNLFNKHTACICTRIESLLNARPKKGDKLRPDHRRKLSKVHTGIPKTEDHKKAISESLKGKAKAPWTEERKAKRRADIAARKAQPLAAHQTTHKAH